MSQIDTPRPAPNIICRKMDDGYVLISPSNGKMRVLNQLGSSIWQALEQGLELTEIETKLVAKHAVPAEQIHQDLMQFINDLIERKLLLPPQ